MLRGEKMPDYKSHSIHSEMVLPNIKKRTEISSADLKRFAFGPDSLMITDYALFDYQHSHNTRYYFETMINIIKERKLQDNSKVMAFLYGQLDHFVLDLVMHPLIYYMTEKMPSDSVINPHALIELWIADYVTVKNRRKFQKYYLKTRLFNKELSGVINDTYKKIYNRNNMSVRYDIGVNTIVEFDKFRSKRTRLKELICSRFKLGDFLYNRNTGRVSRFLNLSHSSIQNPITGDEYHESFDDLWRESLTVASELIEDVNNYLYLDKPLTNCLITNNISYNTGFPCCDKEEFKYVKRYR